MIFSCYWIFLFFFCNLKSLHISLERAYGINIMLNQVTCTFNFFSVCYVNDSSVYQNMWPSLMHVLTMYFPILHIAWVHIHKNTHTQYMQMHLSQIYEGFSVWNTWALAHGNLHVYNQVWSCVEDCVNVWRSYKYTVIQAGLTLSCSCSQLISWPEIYKRRNNYLLTLKWPQSLKAFFSSHYHKRAQLY